MATTTYNVALYFLDHTFAAEDCFTFSETASIEEVFAAAENFFDGDTVNMQPVYVGSVKQSH